MRDFGGIDVVINTAGGNVKGAYYTDEQSLFDLDAQPQFDTVTLNLFGGCFWPCLAYGAKMLDNPGGGSIINFSSISAFTAIRGHIAYAAAKAGVSNFTQSLAAHLARDFNPKLRVNAVAPGFFPNNNPAQMLFNPDGSYRAKAQRGVDATPMHRMGHPNELIGTLVWLASTPPRMYGITVTVDGGISSIPGLTAGGRLAAYGGKQEGTERFRMTSPVCARRCRKRIPAAPFFGAGKKALERRKTFSADILIVALPESL